MKEAGKGYGGVAVLLALFIPETEGKTLLAVVVRTVK